MGDLYVPAINAFVEKMIQDRRSEFTKAQKKEDNWTTKSPTQNGGLPKWPKVAPQSDKATITNTIDRKPNQEALIGGSIIKASVDDAVKAIKTGATKTFDERIVAFLKKANDEGRDLTQDEKKKIEEIKLSRTQQYLREL